ncbi:MAG: hypothetical protein V4690_03320 [Patescibacteria group bacterium]
MLDFQQKRKIRSFLYNRVTLSLLALVVLWAGHSTWGVYQKKVESEKMMHLSAKNVETLRVRQEELKDKMESLNKTEGIEDEIRSRFSVAKEGESMVIILEDTDTPEPPDKKDMNIWEKFKEFVVFW